MKTSPSELIASLRVLATGTLLAIVSVSSLAADACSQWSVQGKTVLVQTNNTYYGTTLSLEQTGSQFKGTGSYFDEKKGRIGGTIVGTVVGNDFEATAYWRYSNSIGVYRGQISPQGLLIGRSYDKTNPASTADFHSEGFFTCLALAPKALGPGTAAAKPPLALGRVQTGAAPQPPTSICDAAQSARARNSPTAHALERRCKEFTEALNFTPRVLEPAAGSVHRPQTALAIRVEPGKTAQDSAYEIEIQVKANFDWRVLTNIPVNAAIAKSGMGYLGWGARADGSGAQMTAIAGDYRLRATATAPRKSAPSMWVEFKIAGTPGVTKDDLARSNVGATAGARAAFGLPAKAATNEAPRTQAYRAPLTAPAQGTLSTTANRADAAALNPQPLPPKPSPTPSPLTKATRNADAVSLNPQPLPPTSPVSLPNQAPSALR